MGELLRVAVGALVDSVLTVCGRKDLALARHRRPTENLQVRASLRRINGNVAVVLPDGLAKLLRFHDEVTIEPLGSSFLIKPIANACERGRYTEGPER
jgi:hypothetical protein